MPIYRDVATDAPAPRTALPRRWLATVCLAGGVALAAVSYGAYRLEVTRLQRETHRQLSAIAGLKATQLAQWRQERLADVRRPAESPFSRRALTAWARSGFAEASRAQWVERLNLERAAGFADALIFDPAGRLVLSVGGTSTDASRAGALVAEAIRMRAPVLSDLFADGQGRVYLDAAAPVFDEAGTAVAVFAQRSDAASVLFPLVRLWPVPSDTAESYLVEPTGDEVVVLTPMRQDPEATLRRRYRLDQADRPAVRAVLGHVGAFDGTDYRGVHVLADLRPVEGSPWFQVVKVDADEVLREARVRGVGLGLIALLSVLLAGAAVASLYGRRQARLYLDLYESERRQRDAQEQFRTALYSIGDALITTDRHGCVRQMNPVAERLTGWPEAEAAGRRLAEVFVVVNEETRHRLEDPVSLVLREGTVVGLANHALLLARDGREFPIADSGAPIREADGTIGGTVLVFSDQTAERAARRALQESEARYRLISRLSTDFAYSCVEDERGRFRVDWITDAYFTLTGYTAEDLAREGCWMFPVHPDDRAQATAFLAAPAPGDRETREFRVVTRDGRVLWFANQVECLEDGGRGRRRLIGAVRDVTERRRAEDARDAMEGQLRQGQKMEAIGRLAGGVAHDFNNMLQTILGFTDLALAQLPAGHPVRADVEEIDRAARRSADLTRQLLAFARKQTIAPRRLDLNDTVGSLLKMLRRLIGEHIELRWEPGQDLPPVKMDPSQLDQVLANLVVNARDAIVGAGTIRIETAAADVGGGQADALQARAGMPSGRYAMIAVHDTGSGMDAQTLARLFEPFFTTKPLGQGTGLGLSTVYGIVRQNDGYLDVTSAPGRGSAFRIFLPAAPDRAATVSAGAAVPAVGGRETILLVEDDPSILRLTTRLLGRLGYTVLPAATPGEALELAQAHGRTIDLLVTDVVMPGMSGRELRQRLADLVPSLRCLYTSGYTADVIAHHGVLHEGVHFLQKPFSRDDLARKVREVLAS